MQIARSKFALVVMLAVAGCAPPGGPGRAVDPCVGVGSAERAILDQAGIDEAVKTRALAQHVVDHQQCYSADLVAKSRIVLASPSQPLPTPTWAQQNWSNANKY